jgi:hypothetical protein
MIILYRHRRSRAQTPATRRPDAIIPGWVSAHCNLLNTIGNKGAPKAPLPSIRSWEIIESDRLQQVESIPPSGDRHAVSRQLLRFIFRELLLGRGLAWRVRRLSRLVHQSKSRAIGWINAIGRTCPFPNGVAPRVVLHSPAGPVFL